jgi:hypothetical protein
MGLPQQANPSGPLSKPAKAGFFVSGFRPFQTRGLARKSVTQQQGFVTGRYMSSHTVTNCYKTLAEICKILKFLPFSPKNAPLWCIFTRKQPEFCYKAVTGCYKPLHAVTKRVQQHEAGFGPRVPL